MLREVVVPVGNAEHHPLGICVRHIFGGSPGLFDAVSPMRRRVLSANDMAR
jgi:hypothetical protein